MSINAAIKAAVEPVVPVCVPNVYKGEAKEYTTFNATDLPDSFGDDSPETIRYLVQIHYCCPVDVNPLTTKRALCRSLAACGFTYPTVTDASDDEGQHFVLECEYADGDV